MDLITELSRRLSVAKTERERQMLEMQILMAKAKRDSTPRVLLQRMAEAILAAVIANRAGQVVKIIDAYMRQFFNWLEARALEARLTSRERIARRIWATSTPRQRRGLFGLPVDDQGEVKPPPGLVEDLELDEPTEQEVFEHISPMLVITGDKAEAKDRDPVVAVLAKIGGVGLGLSGELLISDLVRRGRRKIASIIGAALRDVAEGQDQTPGLSGWFQTMILSPLGLTPKKTIRSKPVDVIARDGVTVAMQGLAHGREEVIKALAGPTLVGYTLHSVFAENTRPAHALRDGSKFYADNREGSYKPWSERIIPPYWFDDEKSESGQHLGGNCLCFAVEILATPEGEEYSAEFGLRDSGGRQVTPRDVGTLRTWFSRQKAGVRMQVVGKDAWDALGDDNAQLEDFYDLRGNLMKPKTLSAETPESRTSRASRVLELMRAQERRHLAAWEKWDYNDRFDRDPVREQRYRERLRALMEKYRAS